MKRWELLAMAAPTNRAEARRRCNLWGENPDEEIDLAAPPPATTCGTSSLGA